MRRWYFGIHRASWLADPRMKDVPSFISRRVLLARHGRERGEYMRTLPRAVGPYAVDSGGFTELQQYGEWRTAPEAYVAFLRRLWSETGPFDFAAPMDWMCEPWVMTGGQLGPVTFAGTGQSIAEHLLRTVLSFAELRRLAPELPIIPVVQGWTLADYLRCCDMYAAAGVDLAEEPLVGLGTLCRRQSTSEAVDIITGLRDAGVARLHGFGFKILGLRAAGDLLETADSMAWSIDGRRGGPCSHPPYLTGKQPSSEANCLQYGLAWRARHITQGVIA